MSHVVWKRGAYKIDKVTLSDKHGFNGITINHMKLVARNKE